MNGLKLNGLQALTYGLPLLVILVSIALAISPLLKMYPELVIGITYDLTLTAPILYLLLSRKSRSSKLKAVPFFIAGIILASYLLPERGQTHLEFIKLYALPIVEIMVLGVLIHNIRKGLRIFKSHNNAASDFIEVSKKSAEELFGKSRFVSFFSSEVSMMYYAVFAWKRRKTNSLEFTSYKENASIALAGALLMVVFIETFAFHFLLAKWSTIAAWILTATSIYTAIAVIANIKALLRRPSILTREKLILKNGLIADIEIQISELHKVEACTTVPNLQDVRIGNLGLAKESTNYNVALYFKTSQTIQKMYGFTEECDVLLIHIDDRDVFVRKVNAVLSD